MGIKIHMRKLFYIIICFGLSWYDSATPYTKTKIQKAVSIATVDSMYQIHWIVITIKRAYNRMNAQPYSYLIYWLWLIQFSQIICEPFQSMFLSALLFYSLRLNTAFTTVVNIKSKNTVLSGVASLSFTLIMLKHFHEFHNHPHCFPGDSNKQAFIRRRQFRIFLLIFHHCALPLFTPWRQLQKKSHYWQDRREQAGINAKRWPLLNPVY